MKKKNLAEIVLAGTILMMPQTISNSTGYSPDTIHILSAAPILSPIKRAGLEIYGENQKTLGTDFFTFYRFAFSDSFDTTNPLGKDDLGKKTAEEILKGKILRDSLESRYAYLSGLMKLEEHDTEKWRLINAYSAFPQGAYRTIQHEAIDIFTREGNAVIAPFDGIVVASGDGWEGAFHGRRLKEWNGKGLTPKAGNAVILFNPYERGYMLISHLQEGIKVEAGKTVVKGQLLGYVGHTGSASIKGHGRHIHVAYKLQDEYGNLRGIDFSERLK